MLNGLMEHLEALYPEMVELRRDLHMHPELSFEEVRTPAKVAEYLQELGLTVRTGVGGRGVVAVLEGSSPGKTIALRADFDALPIEEENDLPYASTVPGVMHACGHDIHTATLLGVARVLSEVREKLVGKVVFIHQFAEEKPPGGAQSMIEDGCLDGVDVIYGIHVWSPLPYGQVAYRPGPAMAAADDFEIVIKGQGGHGAVPHTSIDPLVTASALVGNLQQVVSRRVSPLSPAVLTVGTFHAGSAPNVIPDTAKLTGTVRTFDDDVRTSIEKEMKRIVEATCDGAGATSQFRYNRGYPPVVNHREETETVASIARRILGDEWVNETEAIMGGEDFAYYLQEVPGCFFYVGGRNEELGATFPHHHPRFDVDERAMLIAGRMFLGLVLHETGTEPQTEDGASAAEAAPATAA